MCGTCGCERAEQPRTERLEMDLLAENDRRAEENRQWLAERPVLALNLIGAPGAGKTTILERTIGALPPGVEVAVVEGDQATARDAARIRSAGFRVVQKNTGTGCHLDARMVASALEELAPAPGSILFVENVGNLVCPALFDLGERAKVAVMSVTEGEDKPLKYPHIFRAADALILNKIDLLPHLSFDLDRCLTYARRVNPRLEVFPLSAERYEGVGAWCDWLEAELGEPGRAA